MRATITALAAALVAGGLLAASPAGAQQESSAQQQGPDKAGTESLGSPAVPAAAQGGVQGNCPAGQVASVNGQCAPGQPGAEGGTHSTQMPASPHQQGLLKGQQGAEEAPK